MERLPDEQTVPLSGIYNNRCRIFGARIERRCLYQSASAIGMDRTIVAFACLLSSVCLRASDEKQLPSFDYYVARAHEIKRLNRIVEPFRFKVCARVSIHFTSRLPCPP
jgi:hypothetical protein